MFFKDQYYYLSNMYPCEVKVILFGEELTFPCLECAFQAHKSMDLATAKKFLTIDGYKAKKLGKKIPLRHNWEFVKETVMLHMIACKFVQNPDLLSKLAYTRPEPIIEENDWNDTIWGVCNGVGVNRLGKLLTFFRDNAKFQCIANCPEIADDEKASGCNRHCVFDLERMYDDMDRDACPCGNHTKFELVEDSIFVTPGSVCNFTGRRPKDLYGYVKEPYIPIVDKLKEDIEKLYFQGYRTFITGGAQGFDQLAFWAVHALKRDCGYKMNNIVYAPFKGQELVWKEEGLFSQKEYRLMLSLADNVTYTAWNTNTSLTLPSELVPLPIDKYEKLSLNEEDAVVPLSDGSLISLRLKMKTHEDETEPDTYYYATMSSNDKYSVSKALLHRNHCMVDETNLTYGLYPDYGWIMTQQKGGTAECLRYAMNNNKKIMQLSNETMCSGYYHY